MIQQIFVSQEILILDVAGKLLKNSFHSEDMKNQNNVDDSSIVNNFDKNVDSAYNNSEEFGSAFNNNEKFDSACNNSEKFDSASSNSEGFDDASTDSFSSLDANNNMSNGA